MLWLVLLCVVTVGTSSHPSDDVTWLALPKLPPAQDSVEKGSSYTDRLVQHWHSRHKTTTHRPPHRPISSDKYHTFHSRLDNATHRLHRTSSASDDDVTFHSPPHTPSLPSDRHSNHLFHSRLGNATYTPSNRRGNHSNHHGNHSNHLFHSRLGNATYTPSNRHGNHSNHTFHSRLGNATYTPSNRHGNHYVNDVDLFSTVVKESRVPAKPPPRGVYKAWPGETPVESLDDLMLYHTYTSGDKPNNFKLDSSAVATPASELLDRLVVFHAQTSSSGVVKTSTTPRPSFDDEPQYDLVQHHLETSSLKTSTTTQTLAPGDNTKLSLDELILLHTHTTDDNPKPSYHKPHRPSNHKPAYHYAEGSVQKPTWDHHHQHQHKPQRPNVILVEDVRPTYDHGHHRPVRPLHHHPPAPQTVYTLLTHRPDEQTTPTSTPSSHEAAQIVVINNHYPAHDNTVQRPPYYSTTQKPWPHYTTTTTRRPHYTVYPPYPVPYPDDFTTRRPPLNVHTTHRPSHVTITSPQSHYNTHRPFHVTSTLQSHYSTHRPPHISVSTPQTHYPSYRPPQVTVNTPQSHYPSHRPPQVTVNTPQTHYPSHRPPQVTVSTPQTHYTTHGPSYVTVTTPQSHYNTHRPSYVTATTPQPPYVTHRPSHVTINSPQSHYPPLFVSSTTTQSHYPSDKPTYQLTTPKPQYTTPKPPYVTTAIPSHPYYPTVGSIQADKPPQVHVVCPNITITSTINNYNAYTNVTKEGCAEVNIVINNENLLIKDPNTDLVSQSPPNINGEPFPPMGDDPGDSVETPGDVSGEGPVDNYTPIVNRPWLPWDMIGIKGPLLDVLELLTLFWASLPTNIMVLLIVVGTIKKFALGLGIALALWKHKQKKMKKKSMEVHNTHLHLKGIGESSDDSHYHKTRRKYQPHKEDYVEYEERDGVGEYGNHREEYGGGLGGGRYENHREVYGGALAAGSYHNHREEYGVDPRTGGRGGYTRTEDYEDALGGGREGYEQYDEDVGNGDDEEYDPLAGGRRMDGGSEAEMEYLDRLEEFVRGLIDAFQVMPDEGGGGGRVVER